MADINQYGSSSEDETSEPVNTRNVERPSFPGMRPRPFGHRHGAYYTNDTDTELERLLLMNDEKMLDFQCLYQKGLTRMSLPIFDMRKVPLFSSGQYDKCLADRQISHEVLMKTVSKNMKADKSLIHILENKSSTEGTRLKTAIVILPPNLTPDVCYLMFEVREYAGQVSPTLLCGRFKFGTSIKEVKEQIMKERQCKMLGLLVNNRVINTEMSIAECDLENLSKIQVLQLPSANVKFHFRPKPDFDLTLILKDVDMNGSVAEMRSLFMKRFGPDLDKYKTEGKGVVHFCFNDKLLLADMCVGRVVSPRREEVVSIHLSAADVIYLIVKFRKPLKVEPKVMIVSRKCSTENLREEIVNLLSESRDPKSIKATLNGSLIEEHESLADQYKEEWHDGIVITVGVKKCKKLKIKNPSTREEMAVEIYMLENVSVLKEKVAEKFKLNINTISLLCKGNRMESNHLLQQYPIKNNMEIQLDWFPNRIHVNVYIVFLKKQATVTVDDSTKTTVDDLLRLCAHEFGYCRAWSRGIFENRCLNKRLTLNQEGICHGDKVVIVKFDQVKNFSNPALIPVYEASTDGYVNELLGTVQGHRLFYAPKRDCVLEVCGSEGWNNGARPCGVKLCDDHDCTTPRRPDKLEVRAVNTPETVDSKQSKVNREALRQKFIKRARKLHESRSFSTSSDTQYGNHASADVFDPLSPESSANQSPVLEIDPRSLESSANQSPGVEVDPQSRESSANQSPGVEVDTQSLEGSEPLAASARRELFVENEDRRERCEGTMSDIPTSTPRDKTRPCFYCGSLPEFLNTSAGDSDTHIDDSNQDITGEEGRVPVSGSKAAGERLVPVSGSKAAGERLVPVSGSKAAGERLVPVSGSKAAGERMVSSPCIRSPTATSLRNSGKKKSVEFSDETFLKAVANELERTYEMRETPPNQGNNDQSMPPDLNVRDFIDDSELRPSDRMLQDESQGTGIRQSRLDALVRDPRRSDTSVYEGEQGNGLYSVQHDVDIEPKTRRKEIAVWPSSPQTGAGAGGESRDDLAADHRGQDKDKSGLCRPGQVAGVESPEIRLETRNESHEKGQEVRREGFRGGLGKSSASVEGNDDSNIDYKRSERDNVIAQESAVESASDSEVEPDKGQSINRSSAPENRACARGSSRHLESNNEKEQRKECIDNCQRRIAFLMERNNGNGRQSNYRKVRSDDSPLMSSDQTGNGNAHISASYHSDSELGAVGGVPRNQLVRTARPAMTRQISIHDMMVENGPEIPNAGISHNEGSQCNAVVQRGHAPEEWRCRSCQEKGGNTFLWTVCPYHQPSDRGVPLLCNVYTCKALLRGMHKELVQNAGRPRSSLSEGGGVQQINHHRGVSERQLQLNGELLQYCPVVQPWLGGQRPAAVVHLQSPIDTIWINRFDYISTYIGEDWKRLVRKLGLSDPAITNVGKTNRDDLREAAYQALLAWKQEKGNDMRLCDLQAALLHISRKDLADSLAENWNTA